MHACFGLFFGGLNYFITKHKFVPGMTLLTSATLLMELLRYRPGFGWMNDALHAILGGSLRKHEMEGKFTGSFYFFLGVTVTAALYPKTCATMGICQLALADPSASYFGRQTRHVYWSRIEKWVLSIYTIYIYIYIYTDNTFSHLVSNTWFILCVYIVVLGDLEGTRVFLDSLVELSFVFHLIIVSCPRQPLVNMWWLPNPPS